MKLVSVLSILAFYGSILTAQDIGGDYYVSVNGNDLNDGSYARPWATWQKAFATANAGDIVYIMGGTYYTTRTVEMFPRTGVGHKGLPGKPICFFGYPGQTVILDCRLHCDQPKPSWGYIYNSGISLQETEHVYFKDFTVRNVFVCDSNRIAGAISVASCANLTFENITIHQVGQRGYWLQSGAWNEIDGPNSPFESDTTRWINCDVYDLCDTLVNNPGNAADAWKIHTYENNYFLWEGCRAWNYSDDGIDVSGQGTRVLKNCWVMPTDKFVTVDPIGGIEANGFKLGAVNPSFVTGNQNANFIVVQNCIAANGGGTGFYDLDYETYRRTNALYYNNSAYRMGIGFRSNSGSPQEQETAIWINNISYGSTTISSTNEPLEVAIADADGKYSESHNTWDAISTGYPWFKITDSVSISDGDFMSLDFWQLTLPRKPGGSLPDITFLRPRENSDLVDKGRDKGLFFVGSAPEIGALEYDFQPGSPNKCPNVKIVFPSHGMRYNQSIDILLTGSDDKGISSLELFDNGKKILEKTSDPWLFSSTDFSSGTHSLRAVATDTEGCQTTSSVVTFEAVSQKELINLYPNPNKGSFTLVLPIARSSESQISIISNDGRIVHSESMPHTQSVKEFNLPYLSPGLYILVISSHETIFSRLFVKN